MSIAHSSSVVTSGLVAYYDAANVRSFDYRENLFSYTQALGSWGQNPSPDAVTITSDATLAPDNTITADKVIRPSGTIGTSTLYRTFGGAINTPYVGSIYLKAGELTKCMVCFTNTSFALTTGAVFDLSAGTYSSVTGGSTATIVPVGNGWYRVSVTATSIGTAGNYVFAIIPCNAAGSATFVGDDVSGVYAWGAQVETGYVATTYTPVISTTTVTRTTTWRDMIGTNNATMNDRQVFNNNSLLFNGTSNFLTIPEFGSLPMFTCEAWFKPTASPGTTQGCVVSTVYGTAINYKIGWTGVGNSMACGFYNGAWRAANTFTANLNQWYHVVFTYDGAKLSTFVNGATIGSNAYIASPAAGSGGSGVRIGRRWDLAEYFTGEIPIVRIYNRPLTDAEALQNFNATRGRYGL